MLLGSVAGLLVGWLLARRMPRPQFAVALVVACLIALLLAAAAGHFATSVLLACLAFWAAAQAGWFLSKLAADARFLARR
jgi:hypothetical protein